MRDLHVHTTFSDGANSVEEMVREALALGMEGIGFSDHSFTSFDPEYCAGMRRAELYRQAVRDVAERYDGRIEVLCGIEQDMHSERAEAGYDYVIGSAHYVEVPVALGAKCGGHLLHDGRCAQSGMCTPKCRCFVSVDETEELFVRACKGCFGGDYYAFAAAYFDQLTHVAEATGATLIGHFDLFSKYNGDGRYFDERDVRYVSSWQRAAGALLQTGLPFEVNVGAQVRGYRSEPYPSSDIQHYLSARGAVLIKTSDAHSTAALRASWDCAPRVRA